MNIEIILQLVKEYKDILVIATQLNNEKLVNSTLKVLNALSLILVPEPKTGEKELIKDNSAE